MNIFYSNIGYLANSKRKASLIIISFTFVILVILIDTVRYFNNDFTFDNIGEIERIFAQGVIGNKTKLERYSISYPELNFAEILLYDFFIEAHFIDNSRNTKKL